MADKESKSFSNQMIAGIVLIGLGLMFLADNFGPFHFRFSQWFLPILFIGIGVLKIAQEPGGRGARNGSIWLGIGLFLAALKLGLIQLTLKLFLPALLIGVGFWILTKPERTPRSRKDDVIDDPAAVREVKVSLDKQADTHTGGSSGNGNSGSSNGGGAQAAPGADAANEGPPTIDVVAILGAHQSTVTSRRFRGGEVTAIMGGCDVHMRNASIDGEAVITVFSLFGSISMKVPADWSVDVQVASVLGGVEDKTGRASQTGKRLVVRGHAVLGGVEIRN